MYVKPSFELGDVEHVNDYTWFDVCNGYQESTNICKLYKEHLLKGSTEFRQFV
jgi:hypothetical protein